MTEEQAKKEAVQDQIVWNTMLFIIVAFILGYILQFVPRIIPQGFFTIIAGLIAFSLVEKRVKFVINDVFQKKESDLEEKYNIAQLVLNQTKDYFSLVQQRRGYAAVIND
ncbi:MAG: hypothetical protein V7L04_17820 [Nostoc sp.]|uniref:hypothetical protein n=1 Tax=Nostoc sp. TaxID=1180 RepID=UPI002FFBBBB2